MKKFLPVLLFIVCSFNAIERSQIDRYIIDTIYQKEEISRQTFVIFKNMLSQYRKEHSNPQFLIGWEKFAESLVRDTPAFVSVLNYPGYSKQLDPQLQRYSDLETPELVKKMQGMMVQLPTQEQVVENPALFVKFKQEVEEFQNMLFAYHFRPHPVIPGKKPFTPSRTFEEERFEAWLLEAQKKLVQLQETIKKLQSTDKLVRDIELKQKDIESALKKLYTKQDIYKEDTKGFKIILGTLEDLYRLYKNKYGEDYKSSVSFLTGIKKQFSVIKIRKVKKPSQQSQPEQKLSAKDKELLEKLNQLSETFDEYRSSAKILPFYFSQLKNQIRLIAADTAHPQITADTKQEVAQKIEMIQKWINQAEPLFVLQNEIQKSIDLLQKAPQILDADIQALAKSIEEYEEKLIVYKKDQGKEYAGSKDLLARIEKFAREKSLELLKKLNPEQQKKEEKKLQEITQASSSASLEEILQKRFSELKHIAKEVEEESSGDWD